MANLITLYIILYNHWSSTVLFPSISTSLTGLKKISFNIRESRISNENKWDHWPATSTIWSMIRKSYFSAKNDSSIWIIYSTQIYNVLGWFKRFRFCISFFDIRNPFWTLVLSIQLLTHWVAFICCSHCLFLIAHRCLLVWSQCLSSTFRIRMGPSVSNEKNARISTW